MKLMLRPEWRLWPLSSFLGFIDLKTGVTVALLFALLNKVAGVYGLIAVLTGAGGSFAQLSLYIYSAVALAALAWGLKAVKNEDPKQTLYFAHLYFSDHIFSTSWTIFFGMAWWLWTPHDGERQANSAAQQALIKIANITHHYTNEERKQAALTIWDQEKGKAAAIIILSWFSKLYFIAVVYSYAIHLRKGSYRSLPLTKSAHIAGSSTQANPNAYDSLADTADDEMEDFYRVPIQTPTSAGHRRSASHSKNVPDFVSAPGRTSRKKGQGSVTTIGGTKDRRIDEEVLFDGEEQTYAPSTSSRARTDSNTDEERTLAETGSSRGKRV